MAGYDIETFEYQIGKLRLEPGDILVVKASGRLEEYISNVGVKWLEILLPPGTKLMLIDQNTDLQILTAAEIEAKTKTVMGG